MLASGALEFAFKNATLEGKITVGALVFVSLFSWSVIITKIIQLARAGRATRKFFSAYHESREALDIHRSGAKFDGAPAYELYTAGREELQFQLTKHPVVVKGEAKITQTGSDSVRVALEEAATHEALALEKGMIVLSTAVAGGPFIGLLGTVWGVMETFSGIARANAAILTAMAPGVAGALIATVIGLLVAIPAMFAYNFMVTTIRHLTQELDGYASRYANQIEHTYVDNRDIEEKITWALTKSEMGENTPAI